MMQTGELMQRRNGQEQGVRAHVHREKHLLPERAAHNS